jgi:hypothetical protein
MSKPETAQVPAVPMQEYDPELMQVAQLAHVNALSGQRDEAQRKAAELFVQLSVGEFLVSRLQKQVENLTRDLKTSQTEVERLNGLLTRKSDPDSPTTAVSES